MKHSLQTLSLVLPLLIALPLAASSTLESFDFDSEAERLHFRELLAEVRCLVCQNQSLADSDAELAHDLRVEVYNMVREGRSDAEILDFLVARYSDFVLYKPPLKPSTWLLWFGPFVLFVIAALLLVHALRRQRRAPLAGITAEERARLDALLDKSAQTDRDKGA